AGKQWQKIGVRHHHGINVPLFSLFTRQSAGIGEFLDLKPLLPWVSKIGFDLIQLLPLNDTGGDPSPYNSLSAFALNPLHISLYPLLEVQDKELNALYSQLQIQEGRVNYPLVKRIKEQFLRLYYSRYFSSHAKSQAYQDFAQERWLKEYALFKALLKEFNGASWPNWPERYKNLRLDQVDTLLSERSEEAGYHIFGQSMAFNQMREVKRCAEENGVLLKGDIPILLNQNSADVWLHRHWFDLTATAGAPPDMYTEEGQNWGFPIYNWAQLAADGYPLWKERLKVAENFYHIYRIDHVLGFFKIFAIPNDKQAKEGQFQPSGELEGIEQGRELLKMLLDSSCLLPIGEDLGNVPPSFKKVLQELGIPGTKVMRWERNWHQDGSFIPVNLYPKASLSCVSTHDSEPLSLWWQSHQDDRIAYCRSQHLDAKTPFDNALRLRILKESHRSASLFHINLLQEYLSLIPEWKPQDPEEERVNTPGIISPKNWSVKTIPAVEDIINNETLHLSMRALIFQ
ncbi:MAG: malQ, partial [Chlamydiales bacterium]|nr:malQ [Chlamydiales bacterium]